MLADPVLDELERVLTTKLRFTAERVRDIGVLLSELASERIAAPTTTPEPLTGDPDDDLILACGADAGVQVIVSGDRRHLLPIGEHRGVRIVTPQALLAELANA